MRHQSRLGFLIGLVVVVVLLIGVFLATRGKVVDGDYIAAAIRTHDSQIRDMEIEYHTDIGTNKPEQIITVSGMWLASDTKRYRKETTSNPTASSDPISTEVAFDGQSTWLLQRFPPEQAPTATVKEGRHRFGDLGYHPDNLAARRIWDLELVKALEDGRANVRPKKLEEAGHACYVVEGRVTKLDQTQFDGRRFKVWLDPKHGYMPRRLEELTYDQAGNLIHHSLTKEYILTEVSPGIWFPTSASQETIQQMPGSEYRQLASLGYVTVGSLTNDIDSEKVGLATVNKIELQISSVNRGIADDRFHLVPPEGSGVTKQEGR